MRKCAVLVALLASMVTVPGGASSPSTLAVRDVRGVSLRSGANALVTYEAVHEFNSAVQPWTRLPGARVPSADHAGAFDGLWADGGYTGFWLAPQGKYQFAPDSTLLQDAYYTNYVDDPSDAAPLQPGDRAELAMASIPWDAPLTWDRERGSTDGRLEWDTATDARTLSARYGDATGQMDAMFVRADIVARGGDVDARSSAVQLPPLVLDLPRTYPKQVQGSYLVAVAYPYTHYVADMKMRVIPSAGKAVLLASVRGYVHEARQERLPGGAIVREWHLPLRAAIMLSSLNDPVSGRVAAALPQGGLVLAGEGETTHALDVAPGGVVRAGAGLAPVVTSATRRGAGGDDGAAARGGAGEASLAEEIRAAASIDASLREPVALRLGHGAYELTLDPDFRGEGVLALRGLRRGVTGTAYADVVSVPYVVVNGAPVKLDRTRLIALRVTPVQPWVTVGHTGRTGTSPGLVRALFHSATTAGLVVDAVYDLGGERYAFVNIVGATPRDLMGAPRDPGSIRAVVWVRSMPGTRMTASAVHYLELPEAGPVTYAGKTYSEEFAAPVDLTGEHREQVFGAHTLTATYARAGYDGIMTVRRAPAALVADPVPDGSASIAGERLAVFYTGRADLPQSSASYASARVALTSDPAPAPPEPAPKPIGERCGVPQAVDAGPPDPPGPTDVRAGWLDSDGRNLYATIQAGEVPAAAPPGTTYHWSFHWRYEHSAYAARATLDSSGLWSFDYGVNNAGYGMVGKADGEVARGRDGHVRIAVPLALLGRRHGDVLRDTGAHSSVTSAGRSVAVDEAPAGADRSYGSGGDYTVGRC